MVNVIDPYDPIFYAQSALQELTKALGLVSRCHMGYDRERKTAENGSSIQIKRAGTFTAQNAPGTIQDLATKSITIDLDQHKEVRFAVSDKDIAYGSEALIRDHIRPAAYALADQMDQAANANYINVPWYFEQVADTIAVLDVTKSKKIMFDNGVKFNDASRLHMQVESTNQANLEALPAFSQWQGAGAQGVAMQQGGLSAAGPKFGFNFFANQNAPTHTAGSITSSAPKVKTEVAVGGTALIIYDTTLTGTMKAGDSFSLSGHTQRYTAAADATAASNEIAITLNEPAKATMEADTAITFRQVSHYVNLGFDKEFMALGFAKLPEEMPRRGGANVKSVMDDDEAGGGGTGLAVRAIMQYDIVNLKSIIVLDTLFGFKVLDPNRAMILQRKTSY